MFHLMVVAVLYAMSGESTDSTTDGAVVLPAVVESPDVLSGVIIVLPEVSIDVFIARGLAIPTVIDFFVVPFDPVQLILKV